MARALANALRQLEKARRILEAKNFRLAYLETLQLRHREVNAATFCVCADIAENIRELEGLAEGDSVVFATGILIAEDIDAQQANDRGNAVAVKFKLFIGF